MRARLSAGLCPRGQVEIPGDKSIAHRALILAALAEGEAASLGRTLPAIPIPK